MTLQIGPLHAPVTKCGVIMLRRKLPSGTSKTKELVHQSSLNVLCFDSPLCNLRPSKINSVPCDRFVQRAYCKPFLTLSS